MKIWILTSETGSIRGGGIGRYVEHASRLLARGGHEVLVICGGSKASLEQPERRLTVYTFQESWQVPGKRSLAEDKSYAVSFPYNVVHYWVAYAWQMAREVEYLVERFGAPDLIESQEYNAIAYYVLERRLQCATFLAQTRVVLMLHSPDFMIQPVNGYTGYEFPAYWRGWMERQCIVRADALLCPSRWLANQVEEAMGEQLPPMEILPCPTDPDFAVRRFDTGNISRRFLFVGRLERRKGVFEMLRECERLWQTGAVFELWLAGSDQPIPGEQSGAGSTIHKLYASHIQDGRLKLLGAVDHADLAQLRAQCDVQIVPSLWENFPYVAIEAMQSGCPLLVSKSGGQAEMIGNGVGGRVFDWDEPDSFARTLLAFLEDSREALLDMGRAGQRRIEELCRTDKFAQRRVEHLQRMRGRESAASEYRFFAPSGTPPERCFNSKDPYGVTVVIPHYENATWLEGAVESAVACNLNCLEVLVVDDGSVSSESHRVLDEIESSGLVHVRVLRGTHAGLPAARNRGVEEARTRYVAFLDADDRYEATFLQRSLEILERHKNVSLVYSWAQYVGGNNSVFPAWDLSFPILLLQNQLIPACVMRREAYLQMGGMDESMVDGLEDWDAWIRFFAIGGRGVAIAECLVRYTVRSDSMYQRMTDEQWAYLAETIRDKYPGLYADYVHELVMLLEVNGHPRKWHHPAAWTPWHLLPGRGNKWGRFIRRLWRDISRVVRIR
jgi:glycosyltransferase involved in cell wall biosynthesis